jgi:hypothetical protein
MFMGASRWSGNISIFGFWEILTHKKKQKIPNTKILLKYIILL